MNGPNRILILSDSAAALTCIQQGNSKYHQDIVYDIRYKYTKITKRDRVKHDVDSSS